MNFDMELVGDFEQREKEELLRTLKTLFETRAGTQPADRNFGIDWSCLDDIPEVAECLFILEAEKKVEHYEPRVAVRDIIFTHHEGELRPQMILARAEEEE